MKALASLLLLAVAGSALLFGLADSAALALGGGSTQYLLAWALLLCVLGAGAMDWGFASWRRSQAAPRAGWVMLAWLAAAGVVLPRFAPWLSPWTAGPPLSLATLLGWIALKVFLGWPLWQLGRRLAGCLKAAGPAGWNLLALGSGAGCGLALAFGLGPFGYLVAAVLVGVATLCIPRPRSDAAANDPSLAAADAPRPSLMSLAPLALLALSVVAGALFVLSYLETFDGAAAPEDAARFLTLAVVFLLGALTFGGALAGNAWGNAFAALACGGLAFGWTRAATTLERFADSRIFNGLVGWKPLIERLNQLGVHEGMERLTEGDSAYVPVLTFVVGVLAWFMLGAVWRILVSARAEGASAFRPGRPLGAFLLAAGCALLLALLAHPALTPYRGALATGAAVAAGAAAALTAPRPRPIWQRGVLAAAVIAVPALLARWDAAPPTSVPFFDAFTWETVAEKPALTSVARVVERSAARWMGDEFLSDGRNLLGGDEEAAWSRALETVFAATLAGEPKRVLAIGAPDAAIARLREDGVEEIHLACDPPELVELALETTDEEGAHVPREWAGVRLDGVTETAAAASGRFDLILIRDEALWQRRRNLLRPGLIATCAAKLGDAGVLAIALDPARCVPGLVGAVCRSVAAELPVTELWLLPRGWRTPRLLVTGRRQGGDPSVAAELGSDLDQLGLALREPEDFAVLRLGTGEELARLPMLSLQPPLSRDLPALAETEYRIVDEIRPTLRAGAVLAELQEALGPASADSLLPFYRHHLLAQLYSTADTLFVPESEWVDVDPDSLRGLMELTRRHPDSALLRRHWALLAPLLVNKREVGLCEEYYAALVDELKWEDKAFLLVLGNAALELLDYETALAHAERVLAATPGDRDALLLKARSLSKLKRYSEAVVAYEKLTTQGQQPEAAHLRALGEAHLDAGDEAAARDVARRLLMLHGEAALGHRLGELLGFDPSKVTHGLSDRD